MTRETDNSLFDFQSTLRHRVVRDLLWACFAPPLMLTPQLSARGGALSNCGLTLTKQRRQRFIALDLEPAPLLAALENSQKLRLGIYFEHLWHFFLEWDEAVDLLAHNLAVHDGKRTIGEFDCIYYCRERGRHIHLELAVKFFLGKSGVNATTALSKQSDWVGPNRQDQLDRKIARLTEHQIQLGEHPAAQPLLEALGIAELDKEIEIKGRLFQSVLGSCQGIRSATSPTVLPTLLPAPCGYNLEIPLSAWWPLSGVTEQRQNNVATHFSILDKRLWLAPIEAIDTVARLTSQALTTQLLAHFSVQHRPLQIAALDAQGNELERFFVVPDDWAEAVTISESHSSQS